MAIWYQQNFQTKTKYIQDSWYRLVYRQLSKHASVNSSGPANVGSVILQRIWSVPSPIALGAWKLLVFVLTLLVFPQFHSWIESRRTEDAKGECFFLVSNHCICLGMISCNVTFQSTASFELLIAKVTWHTILIVELNILVFFSFLIYIQ